MHVAAVLILVHRTLSLPVPMKTREAKRWGRLPPTPLSPSAPYQPIEYELVLACRPLHISDVGHDSCFSGNFIAVQLAATLVKLKTKSCEMASMVA